VSGQAYVRTALAFCRPPPPFRGTPPYLLCGGLDATQGRSERCDRKKSCPCAKCNPDCANHCYSNELSNRREGYGIAEQLLAFQERFSYTESVILGRISYWMTLFKQIIDDSDICLFLIMCLLDAIKGPGIESR